MGCEPVLFRGRPCDWPGCAASTNPSLSFAQLVSRVVDREEAAMRYIGLDVHREFCEVAIAEEGRVRSAGRIRTRRAELELFAQSLGSGDEVALESTGGAVAIARILEAQVARVVGRQHEEVAPDLGGEGENRPARRAAAGGATGG